MSDGVHIVVSVLNRTALGLNRYSYVRNNPLSFTDPSGFEPSMAGEGWACSAGGDESASPPRTTPPKKPDIAAPTPPNAPEAPHPTVAPTPAKDRAGDTRISSSQYSDRNQQPSSRAFREPKRHGSDDAQGSDHRRHLCRRRRPGHCRRCNGTSGFARVRHCLVQLRRSRRCGRPRGYDRTERRANKTRSCARARAAR